MAKIVYIGAERVGRACLERMMHLKKDIAAVITADESLRSKIADYVSFDDLISGTDIPLFKIRDPGGVFLKEKISYYKPDLIVMISWSQILPREIIYSVPAGCVNIHYSLLPARRGGAPLFWAIFDGLKRSGITLHYVAEKIDAGDIIGQCAFDISSEDTAKTLLDKIIVLAPELLARHIDAIETRCAPRIRQDEALATYTPAREPSESRIDWKMPDELIWRFVRALSLPYPPAFTCIGRRRMFFTEAQFIGGKLQLSGYLEPEL